MIFNQNHFLTFLAWSGDGEALVTAVKSAMAGPGETAEATHPAVLAADVIEMLDAKLA